MGRGQECSSIEEDLPSREGRVQRDAREGGRGRREGQVPPSLPLRTWDAGASRSESQQALWVDRQKGDERRVRINVSNGVAKHLSAMEYNNTEL